MKFLKHLRDHVVPNADNNYKPHALSHRSLSLYAGFLIAFKVLTLFSVDFLPQSKAASSAVSVENILELTNYSRTSYGLDSLSENVQLDRAAQAKANDMLANQYFAHNSPQGKTPWNFINTQGYNYIVAGENLAINFFSSEGVEQAWMNSPEHKANILNKDFQDIGIGVSEGQYKGVNAIFVVQEFGTSIDQPFIPENNFTKLATAVPQNARLSMPVKESLILSAPSLNDPGFTLTNKKDLTVSGQAIGANAVYILINQQPVIKLPVTNGVFSGQVSLNEGKNVLNAVSFDSNFQASKSSVSLDFILDSTAPTIVSGSVVPLANTQDLAYKIDVQTQGDPVKVLAALGGQNILLQPTSDPNTWEGTFSSSAVALGQLTVSAYDLAGNSGYASLASFSSSINGNFGFLNNSVQKVNFLGRQFAADSFNLIYLYFVVGLLTLMAIFIGLKKNVFHIGILAHASGMVALAILFWIH